MAKKIFLSFASSNFQKTLRRIGRQAVHLNVHDKVILASEFDLDRAFLRRYEQVLRYNIRGFGYWCWKPQIIMQTLDSSQEGDLIQYTDAGCHLNPRGVWRLREYFNTVERCHNGILAFQAKVPDPPLFDRRIHFSPLTEREWTKGDVFDYFNVRHRLDIVDTPAIGAGIIFIKNCTIARALIKEWLDVIDNDFSCIDDTPSKSSNLEGFKEHRHDQSIFSVLCKLHDVKTISAYEYWYPQKKSLRPDWSKLRNYPIHAKRDKGDGFLKKINLKIKRIIDRFIVNGHHM